MPNTVPIPVQPGSRRIPGRRWSRTIAAGVLVAGLSTGVSGCGFEAQTLQPYTPAAGVNVDVASEPGVGPVVMLRNLMVVSPADGRGYLSATLVVERPDALVAVSGVPIGPDGAEGPPLDIALTGDYAVEPVDGAVVLTADRPIISVTGQGLRAGLTAELTLSFRDSGEVTLIVPVREQSDYDGLTPPPSPSPSP